MSDVTYLSKEISDLGRELTITIPAALIGDEYQTELTKLVKDSKLPGFRKGKVPTRVIEQRCGAQLKREIITKLIDKYYQQYLKDHALNVLELLDLQLNDIYGENSAQKTAKTGFIPVHAIFKFELVPQINLENLKEVTVKQYKSQIEEVDLEQGLKECQKRKQKYIEIEDEQYGVQNHDLVEADVDFVSEAYDTPWALPAAKIIVKEDESSEKAMFDAFTGADTETDINKEVLQQIFPLIMNHHKGERISGIISLPAGLRHPDDPAIDKCEVTIVIHSIRKPQLPEINDELAKAYQVDSLEELRKLVKQKLEEKATDCSKSLLNAEMVAKLIAMRCQQDPKLSIEHRVEKAKQAWQKRQEKVDANTNADTEHHAIAEPTAQATTEMANAATTLDETTLVATVAQPSDSDAIQSSTANAATYPIEQVRDYITQEMRKALLFRAYGANHQVEITDDDIQALYLNQFYQILQTQGVHKAAWFLQYYKEDQHYRYQLQQMAINRKLLDLLAQEVTVEEQEVAYAQLLKLEEERKEREWHKVQEITPYVE